MERKNWLRIGLCLLVVLAMLLGSVSALAESEGRGTSIIIDDDGGVTYTYVDDGEEPSDEEGPGGESTGWEDETGEETTEEPTEEPTEEHIYDYSNTMAVGGVQYVCCANCGGWFSLDEINPGHHWDGGLVVRNATCVSEGVKKYVCVDCGLIWTVTLDMLPAHTFDLTADNTYVTTRATCTQDGSYSAVCTVCGGRYEWNPDLCCGVCVANGYVEEYTYIDNDGNQVVVPADYGYASADDLRIPARGHNWGDGELIRTATCMRDGAIQYVCQNTDQTMTYNPCFDTMEQVVDHNETIWDDRVQDYISKYHNLHLQEAVELPAEDNGGVGIHCFECSICGYTWHVPYYVITAPEITVPSTVVRGEFLEISITNTAANNCLSNIRYDAAVEGYDGRYAADGDTILLPTANLESGHAYQLWVDANADGLDYERTTAEFTVTEPAAGSVILRFSKTEVVAQEEFLVSVYAPGATAIRTYHNGDENARWDGDYVIDTWSHDRSEVFEITVSACYGDPEEDEWTEPSGGVTISTTTPYGTMPAPQISAAESVARGDLLRVTVENPEAYIGEGAPSFEEPLGLSAVIYCPDTDEWFEYDSSYWDGSNDIVLPTAQLSSDYDYELHAYAWAYGWGASETQQPLTVTEPESTDENPIYLNIDKTEVVTKEQYSISAYAPGATALRLYGRNEWDDEWHDSDDGRDGDSAVWGRSDDRGQEIDYAVRACYGDPDNEDDWGEMSDSAHISVRSYDRMPDVTATLSPAGALSYGEDLTIAIDAVEGGEWYWVDVNDNDTEDYENVYNEGHNGPFTATVPADAFTPGHSYDVWVHVNAWGREPSDTCYPLIVRPAETAEGFTLTVNGSAEDQDWPVCENVSIVAVAPAEATGVCIVAGNRGDEGQIGHSLSIDWWSFDWPASYPFMAKYTTDPIDDPDSDWWNHVEWAGYSNVVTLNVTSNGDLPAPQISAPYEVYRGDWLEITILNPGDFLGAEGGQYFISEGSENPYGDVRIEAAPYYEPEDRWFGEWYDWDGYNTIRVPTADLEAGREYILYVNATATGWRNGGAETSFYVREPEWTINTLFDVSRDDVVTKEEVAYSIYAPDAIAIRLFYNGELNDGWGSYENPCEAVTGTWHFDHPDEVDFVAYANWGDLDNEEDWIASETRHVSIHAPNGRLAEAPIEYLSVVEAGQDQVITLGEVEYAESIRVEVRDNNIYDRDDWIFTAYGVGEHVVPAGLLTPGHAYYINVHAEAPGYESSDSRYGFIVGMAPEDLSDSITLTIDGGTEDIERVIDENFHIHVEVDDEDVTGIYLYEGTDWDRAAGSVYDADWWSMPIPGSYTFAAKYTTNEIDPDADWWKDCEWAGYSNAVTVNVIVLGTMPEPQLGELPEIITRGEMLEIPVYNALDYLTGGYGDFRVQACVQSQDNWWSDWTDINMDMANNTGSITMPTATLEPGVYNLIVKATASGWYACETVRELTVVEPDTIGEHPIYLRFSKDTVITKVPYTMSIYAPGAVAIELQDNCGGYWSWGSAEEPCDSVSKQWNNGHPAEWDFTARALYVDDQTGEEYWSDFTDPVHLSVIAPEGKLDPVPVTLSATVLNPGEDLEITFGSVDNAMEYWFEVYDEDVYDWDNNIFNGWFDNAPRTYTVSADQLIPGHTYSIHACAATFAYDNSDTNVGFAVLPEDAGGEITLTVNGSAEDQVVGVGQTMRVVAEAPEDATGVYVMCSGMHMEAVPGNYFDQCNGNWYIGEEKQYVYTARYTTDDIDPESEWWKTCSWAGYADPVTITGEAEGHMPAPIAFVPESVARGDFLTIAINNADAFRDEQFNGTAWVNADIYYEPEDRWFGRLSWDAEAGVVSLPTAELEPGRYYRVNVRAGADGWEENEYWGAFTVTGQEGVVFAAGKTDVLTFEDFGISLYVPGATELIINCDTYGEDWWHHGGGDSFGGWWSIDRPGDYAFSARWMDDEGEWHTLDWTVQMSVIAPNGPVPVPEVTLSDYVVPLGEGLGVDITPVEGLGWAYAELLNNDNNDYKWSSDIRAEEGWHADVPAEVLGESGNYRLHVNFNAAGYESTWEDYYFMVDSAKHSSLKLRINGSTEDQTFQVNEPFTVKVSYSSTYVKGIALYNGGGWEYYAGSVLEQEMSQGDVGTRLWYAKYTRQEPGEDPDWENMTWTNISNIIAVTTTSEGQLPAPEVTLSANPVPRGEMLVVTIDNPYEGAGYNAAIYDEANDRWYDEWIGWEDGNPTISMPTFDLEPGDYKLVVNGFGVAGMANTSSWIDISVCEGVEPAFFVHAADVAVRENFRVQLYAPGAMEIIIRLNDDEWYHRDGDLFDEDCCLDTSGRYALSACWMDENGDWHDVDETYLLNVYAPNGEMAMPEVALSAYVLAPGDSLIVDITPVEGLEWVYTDVHNEDNDEFRWSADVTAEDGWHFEVPAEVLDASGNYRLHLNFNGDGYDALRQDYHFMVDSGKHSSLKLRINGSAENQTFQVGEPFTVKVSYSSVYVKGIALYNGYEWEYHAGSVLEQEMSQNDAGTRLWYAKYTKTVPGDDPDWENMTWTNISNIIEVTTTSNEPVAKPAYWIPESVTRGDLLEIVIDNADDYRGEQYNGTAWVSADVWYKPEDHWYHRVDWNADTGVIMMPTADLESGRNYELHVNAGAEGWSDSFRWMSFTVTEPETDNIRVTVDRTEILTRETAYIGVYAPGANGLRMYDNGELRDWWDDDYVMIGFGDNEPGEHAIAFSACYGDEWSARTEPITITVTAPGGKLPAITIECPDVIQPGEDLTFTVVNQDGSELITDGIDVNVWRQSDGTWMWQDYSDNPVFTIPAVDDGESGNKRFDGENVLEAGQVYSINVTVNLTGSESANFSRNIIVGEIAEAEEGFTLTLDGESEHATVAVNGDIHIVVTAPEEATAIRVYTSSWPWGDYRGNTVDEMYSFGGIDLFPVYARYTTDELPENDDEIDWDSLNWSDTISNTVFLNVTGEGHVASPQFDAPETVARGDLVNVTVTNWEEGFDYHAEFDREEDGWRTNRIDWDGTGTVQLSTINLPAGEYRILVRNHGAAGWEGRETFKAITITEREEPLFTADRAEVMTFDNFGVSLYVPGATELIINCDTYGEDWWHDEGDSFDGQWSIDRPGDFEFSARWMDDEGEWHTLDWTVHLSVIAPNGPVPVPEVTLSDYVVPLGEGLGVDITPVEGLGWAYAEVLNNDNNDYKWSSDIRAEDGWHADVPAEVLGESGNYRLHVNFNAAGYESTWEDYYFMVDSAKHSSLKLRINGSTEDQTFQVNEPFTVKVSYSSTYVKGIALYNGGGWEYYAGSVLEQEMSQGDVGTRLWYAKYTRQEPGEDPDWENMTWTNISNIIAVTTTSEGQLPAPEVTLSANPVPRGEMLVVTIDNPYEGAGYNAAIRDVENDHWFDRYDWNGQTITIPTAEMAPGDYQLNVDTYGVIGMGNNSAPYDITVVEPEEPVFTISKTEVETMEDFMYAICAPGADAVRFCHGELDNPWHEEPGDFLQGINRCHDFYDYDFYAFATYDGGETWQEIGMITVHTSAPNGSLAEPEITLDPQQPRADEDLVITVSEVENGRYVELSIGNVQDEWNDIFYADQDYTGEGFVTFTVPAGTLEPNQAYCIHTTTTPAWGLTGFDRAHTRTEFSVNGGEATGTISLNKTEALRNEEVMVTVDVPGATTLQLYLGENEWRNILGGHAEETFSRGQAGVVQIFARYSTDETVTQEWWDGINFDEFDWNQFNWDGLTDSVALTVVSLGRLDEPDYSLESDTVVRGEDLVIHINSLQGRDEWYGASAHSGDCDYDYCHWDDQAQEIRVPTMDMEAGEYSLWIGVDSVGYEGREAWTNFTVAEPEEPVLETSATNVLTFENFRVWAYAPGAEEIVVYLDGEEWGRSGGCIFDEGRCIFGTGERVLSAAWRDENGDWHDANQTISLYADAPYGVVSMPEVTLSSYTLRTDENLIVDIAGADGLAWVYAEVNERDTIGDRWSTNVTAEDGWHFEVPAETFDQPGNYCLHLNFNPSEPGYEMAMWDYFFVVSDEEQSEAYITINGSDEPQTFLVGEPFTVRVEAPENATAIAVYTDGFWQYFEGSVVEFGEYQGLVYTSQWYARYTTDELGEGFNWEDLNWSANGNVLVITTVSMGPLPQPEVTLSANPVTRGEILTVAIENPFEGANYSAVFNEGIDAPWIEWDGQNVYLPTGGMAPGDYELHVFAFGRFGYDDSEIVLNVTVVDAEDVVFALSKTEVNTYENFSISMYAPGATAIRIVQNDDVIFEDETDSFEVNEWQICNSGDYVFSASWCDAGGEWHDLEPVTLTATAPNGELAMPGVTLSGQKLTQGDSLFVWIEPSEGLEWVYYNARNTDNDEIVWEGGTDAGSGWSIEIPSYAINDVGNYELHLNFNAAGYNMVSQDYYFLVQKSAHSSLKLRINGSTDDQTFQVGEPFNVKVSYSSTYVKGIALYNGVEWSYYRGSVLEQPMSQDVVGTRFWYAKYTKTDPGEDPDWENMTWTNIGNVIAVTTVGVPEFTVDKTELLTNERFGVSLYVPGATWLKINLDTSGDDCDWWYYGEGDSFEADDWYFGNTGEYEFSAHWMDQAGDWHRLEQTQTLTVSAPSGEMTMPGVTLSSYVLNEGQSLEVNITPTDELESVYVSVFNKDSNEFLWDSCTDAENDWSIVVPAEVIGDAGNYALHLSFYATGYESVSYDGCFLVQKSKHSSLKLRINGSTDDQTFQVGELFTVRVSYTSIVKGIALYNGEEWSYYKGSVLQQQMSQDVVGTRIWYAKYTQTTLPENPDWENVKWTNIGNVIAVTTVEAAEPAVFTIDRTDVQTNEPFTVTLHVPGAEQLRIIVENDNGDSIFDYDGDTVEVDDWTIGNAGDYVFRYIWMDDAGEWHEDEDRLTVHASASNGELTMPDVTLSGQKLTQGDSLTVTIEPSEGLEWVYASVYNSDDGEFMWDGTTDADSGWSIVVPSYAISDMGNYVLQLDFDAVGYESISQDYCFLVQKKAHSSLKLRINGSTNDQTFQVGETFNVRVSYSSAYVKGIALYNGVEWSYYRGSVLEQPMSQDVVGTRFWYAKYTKTDPGENPDWENLTWTNIGNVVAVTTVEAAEPAVFTIDRTDVETNEPFTVTVHVPGAEQLRIIVENDNGNGVFDYDGDTVEVDDWTIGNAGEYVFRYEWMDNAGEWHEEDDRLTVNVSASNGELTMPDVALSGQKLTQGDSLTVTIEPSEELEWAYASVYNSDSGEFMWDGTTDADSGWSIEVPSYAISDMGNYVLHLNFNATGYEMISEDYCFLVQKTTHSSLKLRINGSAEDQTFQVGESFNVKVYYTSIVKGIALYNGVEWIYHRGSVLEQEMSQDDVGTRIWYAKYTKTDPGDNPDWENLTWTNIGNVIAVTTVEPDEPENSGEPEIRGITMVDPASLPTLTLPGALSQVEAEAFAGSAVQSVKLSDGITAIGERAFANCENLLFVEIPDSVTFIADDAFQNSGHVTFICSESSTAAQFAAEHGIPVK